MGQGVSDYIELFGTGYSDYIELFGSGGFRLHVTVWVMGFQKTWNGLAQRVSENIEMFGLGGFRIHKTVWSRTEFHETVRSRSFH